MEVYIIVTKEGIHKMQMKNSNEMKLSAQTRDLIIVIILTICWSWTNIFAQMTY